MNAIFSLILIISLIIFCFSNPDGALGAILSGGNKGITLAISLLAVYAVWSGFLQIAQDSGLTNKIAKLLKPFINKFFDSDDEELQGEIAVNLSANLLGMGGIATPSGISATTKLTQKSNHNGACLLFVLASTSIQILPTTVIALRQSFGSVSPFNIFLPCLLSTAVSTITGVLLCIFTNKKVSKK